MMLNLNKNVVFADQTPTPTKFIQNCEEVGLFQDLQNVNPFEETFRKATESVKNGEPFVFAELKTEDDALHTPNVPFSDANDLGHNPAVTNKIVTLRRPKKFARIITLPPTETDHSKVPIPAIKKPNAIDEKKFNTFKKNLTVERASERQASNKTRNLSQTEIKLRQESNKAAASRSRKKKKFYYAHLERTNSELLEKNEKLTQEVVYLKSQVQQLIKERDEGSTNGQQQNEVDKDMTVPITWVSRLKEEVPSDSCMKIVKIPKGMVLLCEHNYFSTHILPKIDSFSTKDEIQPTCILRKPFKKRNLAQ